MKLLLTFFVGVTGRGEASPDALSLPPPWKKLDMKLAMIEILSLDPLVGFSDDNGEKRRISITRG